MDTKKDVGEMFLFAPIPVFRPSHCPQSRISNYKPAHAERLCTFTLRHTTPKSYIRKDSKPNSRVYTLLYIKGKIAAGGYKNQPTRTSLLHYRCDWFQSCEV